MTPALEFADERGNAVEIEPQTFVIAGYTGRDRALVQAHIDELAREGIAPPPEVPMWYEMPRTILTTLHSVLVPGEETSGEVEPVLIGTPGALYLGIGSDHTARDLERNDIAQSKRVCPKPVGATIVRVTGLGAALDDLTLESWIDDEPYQRGTFAQITPLGSLLDAFRAQRRREPFVLFCGTVPLLAHGFRFGHTFRARIAGPALSIPLTLEYTH